MNSIDNIITEILQETIKKRGNKFCLVAKSGRNLGCYRSRSGAKKREKQVQYFKHVKEEELEEMSVAASAVGYSGPLIKKKQEEKK